MLPGALSPILGILFVVIGMCAVWLMFDASRSAPQSPRATRMIQADRIAGYLFVALFCLMTWFMILKIKGRTDDLPLPSMLHVLLATLMARRCCSSKFWWQGITKNTRRFWCHWASRFSC